MSDVDQVEEQMVMMPSVEEVIHNAGIEVRHMEVGPGQFLVLLRFHTPAKVYTFRLDQQGAEMLIGHLRGTGTPDIALASPADIPNLRARGA